MNQTQNVQTQKNPTVISHITQKHKFQGRGRSKCKNCGRDHRLSKQECPARNDICKSCNKKGHWARFCLTVKYKPQQKKHYKPNDRSQRQIHSIDHYNQSEYQTSCDIDGMNDQFESFTFDCIQVSSMCLHGSRDEAYAAVDVVLSNRPGVHTLKLKVDTGAQGNTLPLRTYCRMFPENIDTEGKPKTGCLKPSQSLLQAYNGTQIPCLGKTELKCRYETSEWLKTPFFVVDVPGPAVLGLPCCEALHLITLHCSIENTGATAHTRNEKQINNIQELVNLYPDQFDKIGEFKNTYKLVTDPNVPAHVNPPRKTPIALKDQIKNELDKMEKQNVIKKVLEPTEWVSSLVYVTKKDGSIRVCLDPRYLNRALIRPTHKIPTQEELNHEFSGAKFFSKLDAKSGYWSVKLDQESQLLTTFQTPFGRYCFQRLPFGLSVSQDIFQKEMDRILEKCEGACGIADDVVVYGATASEHNKHLLQLMDVAKQHGLVFNSAKCAIKQSSINFFGSVYTDKGIKPDPQKVEDLNSIPEPMCKSELQHFLGLTTYLSSFVKDYSAKSATLRDLLKQDVDFIWEPHHKLAFNRLKQEVSAKSLLQYYNTTKPVYVQCDASLFGLGVALLQPDDNNQLTPIAYASKSLTSAEQRYSCIEREMLSIVFGLQRFHTYLYGRSFIVITDHKPLLMIIDKPLSSAPPRLQRMLVKLQGYKFKIEHCPGKQNQLGDSLSRLPSPSNKQSIDLDIHVDLVQFSTAKITNLQRETLLDPELNCLRDTVITGWPNTIKELPTDLRPFWSMRDEISVENGLLLKGNRIIIPKSMQNDVLQQLHTGHLGQEKTKLRAKDSVFWVNINRDIDKLVKSCDTCQECQPSQIAEPLLQHEIPTRPWSKLGTDLFMFNDNQWLIIADYYSKFQIVKKLPDPCPSRVVVAVTKEVFGEYGIPDTVISDNGPHFNSVQYREFAKSWNFDHVTSSPRYPKSNGFVERQIRTVKATLKKAKKTNTDLDLALLCLRTTPVSHNMDSPGELLCGRKLKANLPVKIQNTVSDPEAVNIELQNRQKTQKYYHDKHSSVNEFPPLYPGQSVMFQDYHTKQWQPALVVSRAEEPRSFIVQNSNGQLFRRNRRFIRNRPMEVAPQPTNQYVPMPKIVNIPASSDNKCTPSNDQNIAKLTKPDGVIKSPKKTCDGQNQKYSRTGRPIKRPEKFEDYV